MGRIKDTNNLKSFNDRCFVVEIEFVALTGFTKDEVANFIAAEARVEVVAEGYNHETRNHWKIVGDSSVGSTDATPGYSNMGLELVSPILKGADGVAQVVAVLNAMKSKMVTNGFDQTVNKPLCAINRTCGLHVHHDVRDWVSDFRSHDADKNYSAINKVTNLISLTSKFENVIYGMLPASRRNGSWSRPINNQYNSVFEAMNGKSLKKRADKVKYLADCNKRNKNSARWQYDRYCGLNTLPMFRHGTVEFRYGSPTLNVEKMINWIVFTQCFVNMAETFKTVNSYSEMKLDTKRNVDLTFDKMRDSLGLSRRMCKDDFQRACALWIRKRYNHFNPQTA